MASKCGAEGVGVERLLSCTCSSNCSTASRLWWQLSESACGVTSSSGCILQNASFLRGRHVLRLEQLEKLSCSLTPFTPCILLGTVLNGRRHLSLSEVPFSEPPSPCITWVPHAEGLRDHSLGWGGESAGLDTWQRKAPFLPPLPMPAQRWHFK